MCLDESIQNVGWITSLGYALTSRVGKVPRWRVSVISCVALHGDGVPYVTLGLSLSRSACFSSQGCCEDKTGGWPANHSELLAG